jgi:hypothetical protein
VPLDETAVDELALDPPPELALDTLLALDVVR